jgi:hypothetical protein
VTGQWFFPGTLLSSTNKADCHNITEIMLKVALNTITLALHISPFIYVILFLYPFTYNHFHCDFETLSFFQIFYTFLETTRKASIVLAIIVSFTMKGTKVKS